MRILFFLLLLMFSSSLFPQKKAAETKMNAKQIKLLVDSLSAALNRWYVYPDRAKLMSTTIQSFYKSGNYANAKDKAELASLLHRDIQHVVKDGHLRVMYFPEFEERLLTKLPDSLVKKEEEMELKEVRDHNFYFVKSEILPGNVGYVRWDGFVGQTLEAEPTFDAAFKFVSNTRALIIDMRYNGGGSPETVNAMLNYFFETRLPMNHIIDHTNDTVKHFTDPAKTKFKLKMPVYVLSSRRTFSGAEDFTYAMKYGKRATIVGDTTGGGAHPTGPAALGQGFVLNIPNARSYHEVTKTNWEGVGVWPDVFVKGELAFEKAMHLFFKECLAKASGEEKTKAEWEFNVFDNKLKLAELNASGQLVVSKEELQKYCGDYLAKPIPGASPHPMSIILNGNTICRHIPIPPDFKLIPVSNTRFVYDNDDDYNRYMEFELDKNGKVTGLTIYRNDGAFPFIKQ